MDKHDHYGHRQRLRDRVKNEGLEHFEDYQVLEYALSFVIPYKDTNPIAHKLINRFGSLGAVLEADENDIKEIEGMGEVSAQFLTSIIKIYNFYEKEKINNVFELKNSEESYLYLKKFLEGKLLEEIYLICLTPKNKIVSIDRVAQGSAGEAQVTLRKITDIVSRNKVNNVILGHNHPKGNSQPSFEDDKFTKALVATLALNESYLLDHIIIGESDYYSYRKAHKIDKYREDISDFISSRKVSQPMAKYEVNDD